MSADCCGLVGLIFGHKYEERYDKIEKAIPLGEFSFRVNEADKMFESMKMNDEIYIQDVCVRCGSVVKRVDKTNE